MSKPMLHIIRWSVAAAAYFYLVYELVTYERYDAVVSSLCSMGVRQWVSMVLCVALMPVNMLLEARRWQTLLPMPFSEAHRQVYYSKLAGLITPWRLGEYPARALLIEESSAAGSPSSVSRVISMGVVGSATMSAAIICAGGIAIAFTPSVLQQLGGSYLYGLLAVILLLAAGFWLLAHYHQMPFARFLSPSFRDGLGISSALLVRSLFQSLVRLFCWCVQLALILYALNASSTSPFTYLPIYFLLVTVTPNIPVVEAGVRGAWAMFLFGTVNAAMAGVLLWGINTLLPCLCWLFMRK